MESSESTPQFSLIVYLDQDSKVLPAFIQDVQTFFTKFPVPYEVLAVVEKGARECKEILQSTKFEGSGTWSIVANSSKKGRAQSLIEGFNRARSPYAAVLSASLSTPLADIFKMLQTIIAEEKVEICFGNRYKRPNNFFTLKTKQAERENVYNSILREKHPDFTRDPLCEVLAMKKSAWEKLKTDLQIQKITGWYLAPHLQKMAMHKSIQKEDTPVFDNGTSSLSYKPWKERLNLFLLSLKI